MSVTDIHIAGYRSIHKIRFPVEKLSVMAGGNGVGKTNLYRSLELLHAAALGTLSEEIAREGGLPSLMWAGGRKVTDEPRLVLEATLDGVLRDNSDPDGFSPTYRIEIGFPDKISTAAFDEEAQVKLETISIRTRSRNVVLMERKGPSVWARDADGARVLADDSLLASETALSRLRGGYPEIDAVRYALSEWRFYHAFRTDPASPLRRPALPVTSPMLHSDGSNLAAVFATLRFIRGETRDLDAAVADAFPGARIEMEMPGRGAEFAVRFPELPNRPFAASELSDGTLHFLALMGALLAYRLPPFIALNEPETSLHPDLLPALARAIAKAAMRSQVWVVTHSRELTDALAQETGILARQVVRKEGGTWLEGLSALGIFSED
ncbi:AAA family ATPase [Paradevosia shaoguanensis]|uniref:AAA family ATPase n=1 Tax=Paradevosia shaoguanensis TaxID=1335043 RepID=UPI003C7582B2